MLKGFKRIAPSGLTPAIVPVDVALVTSAPVPVVEVADDASMDDAPADNDAEVQAPAPSVPTAQAPELTEKFLLAGKALFTVSNPKGGHFTFKVRRVESEWPIGSGRMSLTYFVNVKTTESDRPYQYIGILNTMTGDIKCTMKSVFLPGSKEYDVAKWACQVVIGGKLIPAGYHIQHAGQCGKCGRTLTDPESIERGIGPECWQTLEK